MITKSCSIRHALPEEAALLTALARRSKAYWGYSPEFMLACETELSYTSEQVQSKHWHFTVAEVDNQLLGFYALEQLSDFEISLEALFVEPLFIGQGYGHHLIEHAKARALALGASQLIIQGDPHAMHFYLAAGAILIGQSESCSIPGRFLPTLSITLKK